MLGCFAALLCCACGRTDAPASPPGQPQAQEDCATPGDEDGNGLADCADPACAGTPACAPVCGNGRIDPGEACDEGNKTDGDGCDSNCTVTVCGNGIVTAGEACDDGNRIDGDGCDSKCTVTGCGNGIVTAGEACDDGNRISGDGCENSCVLSDIAYLKPPAAHHGEFFGNVIALSSDGGTLAVANEFQGVDVFVRNGASWRYEASVTDPRGAQFGISLALSGDGSILAVGANTTNVAVTGADGAPSSVSAAGAVYVFARAGDQWQEQAQLVAPDPSTFALFGEKVALSSDGATLAVGEIGRAGVADDGSAAVAAGRVDVFTRQDAQWTLQQAIAPPHVPPTVFFNGGAQVLPDSMEVFGNSLAMSHDGTVLAIGAIGDASSATGVNGDPLDRSAPGSGAVYLFVLTDGQWHQDTYFKASDTEHDDMFGWALALSADGTTLACGASMHQGQAVGAAYVFVRQAGSWRQQVEFQVPHRPGEVLGFATSMALSDDGSALAVGAWGDSSGARGLGGDPSDRSAPGSGAVYQYMRLGGSWFQTAYLKSPNSDAGDAFGSAVAISGSGGTLAVAARGEQSAATGVGGDERDNSAGAAGAVFVYH